MNDTWLDCAIRIQSIAQAGLQYGKDNTIKSDMKNLLVHENNGTWSLPGGWCDVDQSVASNTVKEVKEETGFNVSAQKLIAVQDWRKHNVTNYAYGAILPKVSYLKILIIQQHLTRKMLISENGAVDSVFCVFHSKRKA